MPSSPKNTPLKEIFREMAPDVLDQPTAIDVARSNILEILSSSRLLSGLAVNDLQLSTVRMIIQKERSLISIVT